MEKSKKKSSGRIYLCLNVIGLDKKSEKDKKSRSKSKDKEKRAPSTKRSQKSSKSAHSRAPSEKKRERVESPSGTFTSLILLFSISHFYSIPIFKLLLVFGFI
jgi:hypothetical protein